MRNIRLIILHCSATPEGQDFSVEDIDRWHRQRGFNCIGYHWVVYRDGSVHPGRPEEMVGAHCKGYNQHSIGVCYVGGLRPLTPLPKDKTEGDGSLARAHVTHNRPVTMVGGRPYVAADTRTPEQRRAMRKLVSELLRRYPHSTVHGHYEYANKACPCFNAKTEL